MTSLPYRVELFFRQVIPESLFAIRRQRIGLMSIQDLITPDANHQTGPSEDQNHLVLKTNRVDPLTTWMARKSQFDDADRRLLSTITKSRVVDLRIQNNDAAWLIADANRLVAVCWFAAGRYNDLDTQTTIELNDQESWLYGAWVRREFRGQGIYRQLLAQVAHEHRSRNIDSWLFGVDLTNARSLAVHERLGAKWIGHCYGIKMFGLGRHRVDIDRPSS